MPRDDFSGLPYMDLVEIDKVLDAYGRLERGMQHKTSDRLWERMQKVSETIKQVCELYGDVEEEITHISSVYAERIFQEIDDIRAEFMISA